MPLSYHWYNDQKTILYCQGVGVWTWVEFVATVRAIRHELEALTHDHPIDFLVDPQQTDHIPPGALFGIASLRANAFPQERAIILINPPRAYAILNGILYRVYQTGFTNVCVVKTIADALKLIARLDADGVKAGANLVASGYCAPTTDETTTTGGY